MSPWNIISRFKPKRERSAVGVGPTESGQHGHETASVISERPHSDGNYQVASSAAPERERVVVKISAHDHPVSAVSVDEVNDVDMSGASAADVLVADEAPQVSEASASLVGAKPAYDLRPARKALDKNRVNVRLTKSKPRVAISNASTRDDYVSAVFGIDDDIRQLRAALAEKLEAQNSQLRQLLSRFDD